MSEKSLDATWAAEGYLASRRLLGGLGGLPFKTVCTHVVSLLIRRARGIAFQNSVHACSFHLMKYTSE